MNHDNSPPSIALEMAPQPQRTTETSVPETNSRHHQMSVSKTIKSIPKLDFVTPPPLLLSGD